MRNRWIRIIGFVLLGVLTGCLLAIASADSVGFSYQLRGENVTSEQIGNVMWACFAAAVVVMSIRLAYRSAKSNALFVAIAFLCAWVLDAASWAVGKDLEHLEEMTVGLVAGSMMECVLGIVFMTAVLLVASLPFALIIKRLSHRRSVPASA